VDVGGFSSGAAVAVHASSFEIALSKEKAIELLSE